MLSDMEKLMLDWRLTTAEILYHMPDHPLILQSYLWQDLDRTPEFPQLKKFLHFWERSLDGRLHSVKVASCELIKPAQVTFCNGEFRLH
jgi:uncharacterized protein Usg